MPEVRKQIKDLEVGDQTANGGGVVEEIHSTADGKWHMVKFNNLTRPTMYDNCGGGLNVVVPDPPHPAVQALDEMDAWLEADGGFGYFGPTRVKLRRLREKYGV